MAMIPVGEDVYIDTDDLEQPEYYYFRKAQSLGMTGYASQILRGYLSAREIESNPKYAELKNK